MDDWKSKAMAKVGVSKNSLVSKATSAGQGVAGFLVGQAQASSALLGTGADALSSIFNRQAEAVGERAEFWLAGGSSILKVISGDFRPGRAIICMNGLKLRNRGNAIELVEFAAVSLIERLHTEKRASTVENVKGAALGGAIGGSAGIAASVFATRAAGPLGLLAGGAAGALLSVKHKYHTCRITLQDGRKVIAVAANTNWLALAASLPDAKPPRTGIARLLGRR